MNQLTFEILLNPSVIDEDIGRLSRQCQLIYKLLKVRPVKTSELARIARQYNARLNEIRHMLIRHNQMIDCIMGDGGENTYLIKDLENSTYWQAVIKKGQQWKWM